MKTTKDETGLDSVAGEPAGCQPLPQDHRGTKALEAAQQELSDAVAAARSAGDSWSIVGAAMGTTKQAAYQRFAHDIDRDAS